MPEIRALHTYLQSRNWFASTSASTNITDERGNGMAKCESCSFFFNIPEGADDYQKGKGDCVTEKKDEKGRYWLSKPVFENTDSCGNYQKKR